MKKYFLLTLVLAFTLNAKENSIKVPHVMSASEINKTVSPPKADCESCQELNSYVSKEMISQVEKIKSSVMCKNGNKRLTHDVNFFSMGKDIGKQLQAGFLQTGTASELFVGVSSFNDLMFVTKVTENGKTVGYNVTLSMCELPNAYPQYPGIITNERELVNFQIPYGLNLSHDNTCGYGLVSAAINTTLISRKDPNKPDTSDVPVYTSFTALNCR